MQILDLGNQVQATSPAKLNLHLGILGKRPDGFHEIETVMVKISLYDQLVATSRRDGELTLSISRANNFISRSIPTGDENLVLRAARQLQHVTGVRYGADIRLVKRIPAEAGLAGGSGNAAAAFVALNSLWKLGLKTLELSELAGSLGSDIPFFTDQAVAAIARGRGDILDGLKLPVPLHLVVAKPMFGLSTAKVYQSFAKSRETNSFPRVENTGFDTIENEKSISQLLQNDLQGIAEQLEPRLCLLRDKLREVCPLGSQMTGSGSAYFGICSSRRHAMIAAKRIATTGVFAAAATTL